MCDTRMLHQKSSAINTSTSNGTPFPIWSVGTCLVWREVRIVGIAALIRRVIRVVWEIAIRWVIWIIWVVWIGWVIGIIRIVGIWWIIWIIWIVGIWWVIRIIRIVGIWWVIWVIRIVGIWWIIWVVGKSYPVVSLVLVPRLVLLSIPLSSHDARVPHDLLFRWSNTCANY